MNSKEIVNSGHNWSQQLCSGDVLRVVIGADAGHGGNTFVVEANEKTKIKAIIDLEQDVLFYPVVNIYGKTVSVELLDD